MSFLSLFFNNGCAASPQCIIVTKTDILRCEKGGARNKNRTKCVVFFWQKYGWSSCLSVPDSKTEAFLPLFFLPSFTANGKQRYQELPILVLLLFFFSLRGTAKGVLWCRTCQCNMREMHRASHPSGREPVEALRQLHPVWWGSKISPWPKAENKIWDQHQNEWLHSTLSPRTSLQLKETHLPQLSSNVLQLPPLRWLEMSRP